MTLAIPMPELWVLVVVGGVVFFLFGLAFSAQVGYEVDAGDWGKAHTKWLEAHETTWQSGTEWPELREGLPAPLGDRIQLLMSPSVTSLAEGDLGRFLLRRPEVRGQAVLGSVANLLISLALATTIFGLIVTLFAYKSDTNASEAIRHFPWFFIPTLAGVLLGALVNKKQAKIDAEFELLWDRIDTFTIVHLLPKHIKPKTALDAATEKLAQAAGLFEGSGQKLAGTIGQLESAASKLSQLDPTQWAIGLKDTSEKFERATEAYQKHVGTLGQSVKGLGTMLEQQVQVASTNSQSISDVTALVKEASGYKDELANTLLRFQESVEKVDGLRIEIQQFGSNVSSLGPSLENWAETQNRSTSQLIGKVAGITQTVQPLLDEWKQASGFFSDNHQTFKAELERLIERFTQFQQEFEQASTGQMKALDTLTNSFSKGAIDFWGHRVSQLLEQFDHPASDLKQLRDLLEGAQELGTSLPGMTASLSDGSQLFTQTISSLSGTVEQLASQQKSHQDALIQVSERLAQISEKLDKPRESEGFQEPSPSLSSRTVLGLPIGPPSWMTRLLEKVSREGKR